MVLYIIYSEYSDPTRNVLVGVKEVLISCQVCLQQGLAEQSRKWRMDHWRLQLTTAWRTA